MDSTMTQSTAPACADTRSSARATADILASALGEPSLAQSPDAAKAWWPQSLAGGAPGIAMLHIERARAGAAGWDTAHAWLAVAVSGGIRAGAPGGLFEGGPAVAFAVNAAADRPGKYTRALTALDAYVAMLTRRKLQAARARIAAGELAAITEFDLIYGLTGIGSSLLRREQHHGLLRDVLSYLVALTRPLRAGGREVPGWWTATAPTGRTSPDFPAGHGNFGMAHGIAGPLALLALAMRHGLVVTGHADAIEAICAWLDEWRQDGENGPWWPEWVAGDELRDRQVHRLGPHRPSWCYGTPGLARAQQLAGHATGDATRQRLAEQALAGCLADTAQMAQITDNTICHGTAGVFQTAWRAAEDATTPGIAAQLPRLRAALLPGGSSCGHEHASDAESAASTILSTTGGNLGLLTGAAGTGLALTTAAAGASPRSCWDACLLTA